MRLSNIALAISVIYGGVFTPASLFANGEQGAWYDPSDLTTLFTDSAGTVPVTGVEQFVGLMLDKSKGLVLGSELATGILGSTSGWTFVGAANVTGGAIVFNTPPSTNASAQYNPIVASGKWYQSTITITGTGQVSVQLGSAGTAVTLVAPGTYTFRGLASGGTPTVLTFSSVLSGVNNFVGSVTAISVRELPGNHAFQTNSTKRPKLAARYNLLTYTEQFDNGVWVKVSNGVSIAPNVITAPNGTLTADKLVGTSTSTTKEMYGGAGVVVSGTSYIASVAAKAAEYSWIYVVCNVNASVQGTYFNLATGQIGTTVGSGSVPAITQLGDGWFRVSSTRTATAAVGYIEIFPALSDGAVAPAFIGDNVSGIYIWGADLRPASQATGLIGPTYQRIAAATDYDTTGFLPYLQFDGVDDAMTTNSIDFTATDKMTVFAGVRKLSDATEGMLVELSAVVGSNAGSFLMALPGNIGGLGPNMVLGLNGTAAAYSDARTYTAPITGVWQASFDIAQATVANEIQQRVNGAVPTSISYLGANAGTGNFGNYPLFIGARNQTGTYFNGWLTSLIVRGAQSTQSQIEATESWVNGKTGAF
jgi:hypothetical protein